MEINSDIHYYDSAKRKSKKSISNKIAILVSSLIFSMVVIFLLVSPEFERMKLIELEREVIDGNLKLKNDMIDRVVEFNKTNKDLDDNDLKKIYNLLPENNDFDRQVASISKFAISGGSGISITGFSVSRVKESSSSKSQDDKEGLDLKRIHLDFSLSGDFGELVSLLDSVEENIPLIDVESMSIIREKVKEEDMGKYEIEIEIEGEGESEGENEESKKKSERKNVLNCEIVFLLHHL